MARRFYEKDGNLDFWNGRIAVSLEAKKLRLSPPALTRAGRRGEASTGQPEGAART
jgi:hypothetical protein